MKEIVVVSGKGGGGKTTITSAFATLASSRAVLVDADVDAANLAIIAAGNKTEKTEFYGGILPEIDQEKCISCGACRTACVFDAIKTSEDEMIYTIDPLQCEGCSLCVHICPVDAIEKHQRLSGYVQLLETRFGPLVNAFLNPPGENSGKLVSEVRKRGREIAEERGKEIILVDGPPGIGCPAIASMTNSDYLVFVIEATLSGLSDMKRLQKVAEKFRIPVFVIVNKSDLQESISEEIESFAAEKGLIPAGRIDWDEKVSEALMEGRSTLEGDSCTAGEQIRNIWENIWDHIARTE